jgi:hypothetical protein
MKALIICTLPVFFFLSALDARKDISIVFSTGKCDAPTLRLKIIRNNSSSKTIVAIINQTLTLEGTKSIHIITDTLKPKETKDLGCSGCVIDGANKECTFFSLKSAVYINP